MIKIGYNNSYKHRGTSLSLERPERIEYCVENLKKIIESSTFIVPNEEDQSESLKLVQKVHTYEYIERIRNYKSKLFMCRLCNKKNICQKNLTFDDFILKNSRCSECANELNLDKIYCFASIDTYVTPFTFKVALEAIDVIRLLLLEMKQDSEIKYSFALIRPPGHHCNNDPNGFCIFNNVFIATKYALELGWKKVLILDIDFHHGDGTQLLVEDESNPNISFVSIHGYGDNIYPGTGLSSSLDDNIINFPLQMTSQKDSREYITDEYYQNLLAKQVFPFIAEQNPDIIIISLGFDAHQDDLLEGMNITDSTYLFLTEKLKLFNKHLLFVSEGGYNIKTINRLIPKMIRILDQTNEQMEICLN